MQDLSGFDNFLADIAIYDQNELFWEEVIVEIAGSLPCKLQWMNIIQNEEKWRMGNPMFTAYFPTLQRGIRIIQKDKTDFKFPNLRTWLNGTAYIENEEETDIWELVIALTLTQENVEASQYLLKKWLDENTTLPIMKEVITSELEKVV